MKKILFVIVTMLGMTIYANAQSAQCKIIGTTDGSTATVSIDGYDESAQAVTVGFYNDSEQTVTIIAVVHGKSSGRSYYDQQVVATVLPRTSTTKKVRWNGGMYQPNAITIQSAKCQPK